MSKVALITGANRGIGLELCRLYVDQGYEVVAVCRESSDELEEIADQVISGVDLTLDDAMDNVAQVLNMTLEDDANIDVLINNAGVFHNETLHDMNLDTIRQQFEVNALGPLKVTHALLPFLEKGSKVANITSRMGSVEDNGSGAYYGYRASKAALNAMSKSLAVDLKEMGICVAMLHLERTS